jgi:hypothetical protein
VKTEREVGSGDQVLDHAGDEHLAGVGEGRDTNGDINGQAAEITGDGGGGADVLPVPAGAGVPPRARFRGAGEDAVLILP